MVAPLMAGPLFDTSTPISFFTNVASRLLSSELNVNLSQLEVYPTNQYTPAVHRLLQVTANVLDAQNTNFYPSVFRPLFSEDASNNIFIIGYEQVTNVSGTADPQLACPYPVSALLNLAGHGAPMTDSNGPVNVYGVPWVLGAKQGLPNFNQLSMVTAAQVTRKLEVTRDSLDTATAIYGTNQMYIMGLSNTVGVSFWNSYNAAYVAHAGPLTVFASDAVSMTLTNAYYSWSVNTNFTYLFVSNLWAGSQWTSVAPPNNTPSNPSSFLGFTASYLFQSPLAYDFNTKRFDAVAQWQSTTPTLPQLPEFGLSLTNYLQAFILDGSNVIDYVQICSPTVSGGLNQALADPNYPQPSNVRLQWSTNAYQSAIPPNIPYGAINQLLVSKNPSLAPPVGGQWSTAATPMGITTPLAEAAYFNGFFAPSFQFQGQTYLNRELIMQAPYTPTRTVYVSYLLQANDPLVHYVASDLPTKPFPASSCPCYGSIQSEA